MHDPAMYGEEDPLQSSKPGLPRREPLFIDPDCPDCGTPLVLADYHYDGCSISVEDTWFDDFVCPNCDEDGRIRKDAPEAFNRHLQEAAEEIKNGNHRSLEELVEEDDDL